jgi:hypothetical protein
MCIRDSLAAQGYIANDSGYA